MSPWDVSLIVVDAGECLLSGRLRLPSDWCFCVWMGHQSCGLPQTRSCHSSSIWPVSPGGKRWFRELLCFPFTEKIRIKMNQGLFFFSSGSSELEEKGKRLWLFKVRKKGLGVREMEIMCVWGVQFVQFIFKLVLIWRACFPLDFINQVHLPSARLDRLFWSSAGFIIIRISMKVHLWVTGPAPLRKTSE